MCIFLSNSPNIWLIVSETQLYTQFQLPKPYETIIPKFVEARERLVFI